MKQLLSRRFIASFLFLAVSTLSWANGTKIDGIYYVLNNTSKTASVTFTGTYSDTNPTSTAYSGNVTIPATITYNSITYCVTSIGSYAFFCCSGLTSITIPNSVTSIGQHAFNGCSGLTSVTIPNSVTSIGNYAFEYCSGLTLIMVEDGNPNYDSRDNCNAIIESATNTLITGCKTTTIPNSVTSIGSYAFYGCSGLTSVTIPNSVTSIGNSTFYKCSTLTSVSIPNSVTSIGEYVFYGCSGLTSLTIGNSVTSIEKSAFSGCTGLTSVTIPNSVTSIGEDAFPSNTKIYVDKGVSALIAVWNCGRIPYDLSTDALLPIPSISWTSNSPSLQLLVSNTSNELTFTNESLTVNGVTKAGQSANFTGLVPNTYYTVQYNATITYGGQSLIYTKEQRIKQEH